MTTAAVPTRVPSARAGALLRQHRAASGETLAELVERSFGSFSEADLVEIETGRRVLAPDLFDAVVDLYRIDRDLVRAPDSELVLDMASESLQVGDWWVSFDSPSVDDVLDSYLDMVRAIRGLETAEPFVLRTDDLSTLGDALSVDPRDLLVRIDGRFAPARSTTLAERLRVGAGVGLVAAVAIVGSFVLVRAPWKPVVVTAEPVAATVIEAQTVGATLSTASFAAAPSAVERPTLRLPTLAAPSDVVSPAPVALTARQQQIEAAIPWDFRLALPDWTIHYGEVHADWWGVTNSVERTVTLFDRPGTSVDEAASVLVHELGHALDLDLMSDRDRMVWMDLRGIDSVWWAGDGLSDFAVGAGDFAEAVAAHVLDAPSRSEFGDFTAEQLEFVAGILARS